jgi:hypothetical protein
MTSTTWVDPAQAAYRRMAREAHYRPAAPSDGFGNITGRLNLDREARDYAADWRGDEDRRQYNLGCPSFEDRETLIFIVEAARLLCGVQRRGAAELLRMALGNLERRPLDHHIT